MAPLRRLESVESGDLDQNDSLQACVQPKWPLQAASRMSPRKKTPVSYGDDEDSEAEERQSGIILQPKTTPKRSIGSRQIRLAPRQGTLMSTSSQQGLRAKELPPIKLDSPRKVKATPAQIPSQKLLQSDVEEPSDNVPEVDVDESIWCGSGSSSDDSEDELPSPSKFFLPSRKTVREASFSVVGPVEAGNDKARTQTSLVPGRSIESRPKNETGLWLKKSGDAYSRPGSSSDKENQGAFLRFSPPRLHRPQGTKSSERPITPPQSPSKSRLQSPSKTKTRIPTPPHRPSLDAFWDADTVNEWNEQHSPKKILKSPRKLKFLENNSQQSPTSSPRKSQSPFKRTKAELQAKKTFETSKHRVAEEFLAELDAVITDGKISKLAASTGGVRFIWSKTLNSTAGRANWRRETTKTRHMDGTISVKHKHHASIELAEKVIDDEDRLVNVIAHEFCHLANFMVSGIKDQPHGRQFKEWGHKCTAAFSHRGVKVTTKHSFEIEYKYIWQCSNEDCGVDFKRHSKSIDPKRHTCGSCRSKLVQIRPVPRKTDDNGGTGSAYAAYVKANFATVKMELFGASQKDIMQAVARKYREEKRVKESAHLIDGDKPKPSSEEPQCEIDQVAKALEVITIEDD